MVCVFPVAVLTAAIAPFGLETLPAIRNCSDKQVLSTAKSPVLHVRKVAKGSLCPLFASLISPLSIPLTPPNPLYCIYKTPSSN